MFQLTWNKEKFVLREENHDTHPEWFHNVCDPFKRMKLQASEQTGPVSSRRTQTEQQH